MAVQYTVSQKSLPFIFVITGQMLTDINNIW